MVSYVVFSWCSLFEFQNNNMDKWPDRIQYHTGCVMWLQ